MVEPTNQIAKSELQKLIVDEQKLLENNFEEFYVSVVTFMELYGFKFKNQQEKERIDKYFHYINILHTNSFIANKVIQYRISDTKKIRLPDAIILATAAYLNATLLTDDWDDFENIENKVTITKLDGLKVK